MDQVPRRFDRVLRRRRAAFIRSGRGRALHVLDDPPVVRLEQLHENVAVPARAYDPPFDIEVRRFFGTGIVRLPVRLVETMSDDVPSLQRELLEGVGHHRLLRIPREGGERLAPLRLVHPRDDLVRGYFRERVRILRQGAKFALYPRPDAPSHDLPVAIRRRVRRGRAAVEHQRGMAVQLDRSRERGQPVRAHGIVQPLLLLEEVLPPHDEEATGYRPPYPGEECLLALVGADDVDGDEGHGALSGLEDGVPGGGVDGFAEDVIVRVVGEVAAQYCQEGFVLHVLGLQVGGPPENLRVVILPLPEMGGPMQVGISAGDGEYQLLAGNRGGVRPLRPVGRRRRCCCHGL
mmetsp:Transcript_17245/g.41393  ORF Transcript_17245/g.41393 Transcript_17245/m.41393 type:complete len:348 (+) Transcript_17245:960-2003(+)